MTISNSTLRTDVFEAVRTTLVAAAITVNSILATVNVDWNDKKPQRPQITIEPIGTDESEFKFGSNEGKKFINVPVTCHYGTTAGMDEMADAVSVAIKGTTFDNIELIAISTDFAFNLGNGQKFDSLTTTFSFDWE